MFQENIVSGTFRKSAKYNFLQLGSRLPHAYLETKATKAETGVCYRGSVFLLCSTRTFVSSLLSPHYLSQSALSDQAQHSARALYLVRKEHAFHVMNVRTMSSHCVARAPLHAVGPAGYCTVRTAIYFAIHSGI